MDYWKTFMNIISICRRTIPRRFFICLLVLAATPAPDAYAGCFAEAGKKYSIDPLLLQAIAQVESSMNPQAINHNRNGSEDLGLMQINSSHLARLRKDGITRQQLLDDACLSVMVGAGILSEFITQFGYTWRAVGAYNAGGGAGRDLLRERYATKVIREYRRLSAKPELTPPGKM